MAILSCVFLSDTQQKTLMWLQAILDLNGFDIIDIIW